eukprot:268874-Hanusia_phi.AAC.1
MGYNTSMQDEEAWTEGVVDPNDGKAEWSFSRQSSSRRKEPLKFDWEEERTLPELTDPKLDYRSRYNQWHEKLVKHSQYVSPTEEEEETGDLAGFLEANRGWEERRKGYDWSDGYGRDTGSRKYKQMSKVWAEDH